MVIGTAISRNDSAIPWKGINAGTILCFSMGWLEGGGVEDYVVLTVCHIYAYCRCGVL